jgi:hypothetical protein
VWIDTFLLILTIVSEVGNTSNTVHIWGRVGLDPNLCNFRTTHLLHWKFLLFSEPF